MYGFHESRVNDKVLDSASQLCLRSVVPVTPAAPASYDLSVLTVPPVVHTTDITKVKVCLAINYVYVPATTTHDW